MLLFCLNITAEEKKTCCAAISYPVTGSNSNLQGIQAKRVFSYLKILR